ncbi:hypothetical protein [Companilactobacillus nuruki]|uniref:Uncharacterized protein n=1 Tax=Companilactobacillus nuruki TaxID=1993540 RepID=A0A2N7AV40_9LACO|nr:hypothetical protein [Companilactobacillus nuruki]PMD71513.1 hypothetical protein CBP76_05215 [Companilactobacillus nuruki]
MKIAVQLDDNRNIVGTVTTNELGAELQVKLFKDKGWVLVDSDPAFSSAESYLWTIRESDNKLVHVSTGMTPDEEKTQADALLGKNVGVAIATANTADQKADNAIAGLALLGKQVAAQNTATDGGTK